MPAEYWTAFQTLAPDWTEQHHPLCLFHADFGVEVLCFVLFCFFNQRNHWKPSCPKIWCHKGMYCNQKLKTLNYPGLIVWAVLSTSWVFPCFLRFKISFISPGSLLKCPGPSQHRVSTVALDLLYFIKFYGLYFYPHFEKVETEAWRD